MKIAIKNLDYDTQDVLVDEMIKAYFNDGLSHLYENLTEALRDERLKDQILENLLYKEIECTADVLY